MDNYEKIGVQEVELKMVSEVSIRYYIKFDLTVIRTIFHFEGIFRKNKTTSYKIKTLKFTSEFFSKI
jgi:hypothetical protein